MLFDTSYKDKKTEKQIDTAVGLPFSLKERWKLKGIGSKRLTIADIADEYKEFLNAAHYPSKANIELRPKGIIVHFRHKLQAYSWIMPFRDLDIENQGTLQLTSDSKRITFREKLEASFINKIEKTKSP